MRESKMTYTKEEEASRYKMALESILSGTFDSDNARHARQIAKKALTLEKQS